MHHTEFNEVPLAAIRVLPGFNPRRFFDEGALNTLAASIRNQGVIQPITLRPDPDNEEGFTLVAGERRFRAARLANLASIPAVIRNYTDQQALAAASIENQERENISVAEESQIARRALDATDGDKAEACRLLGWPASRLEARLLLLNAESFVLDAVASKQIRVGHAELLSGLTPELQRSVFDKIVAHNVPVDTLRAQLSSFTQDLNSAIFDIAGCAGCPSNSTTQSSLFEFHVGEGRCSNRTCWDQKTTATLDAKKVHLSTEYPLVFFTAEKDPATYISLEVLGDKGVGEDQFNQGCKGCAKFGALIDTAPGRQGTVQSPVCFNRACNSEKNAAYLESIPTQSEKTDTEAAPAKGKAKSKAKAKPVTTIPGSPRKVTERIQVVLRELAAEHASNNSHIQAALCVYALRSLMSDFGGGSSTAGRFSAILSRSPEELAQDQTHLITKLLKSHTDRYEAGDANKGFIAVAAKALDHIDHPLAGAVPMDRAFLEAHTKSGLESLLASADFYRSLEGQDDDTKQKAFKKLMSQKNGDIVDAVLKSGHDFSSFLPNAVSTTFKALKESK